MQDEDNVVDLNTEILISIRDELRAVRTSVETLEGETIRGFTAVRTELDGLNRRLDHIVELVGTGHRDHEGRIAALEAVIANLAPARPRARR